MDKQEIQNSKNTTTERANKYEALTGAAIRAGIIAVSVAGLLNISRLGEKPADDTQSSKNGSGMMYEKK